MTTVQNTNYKNITQKLLRDLPPRTKEVVARRFGLEKDERETLEAIGKSHGITRERVRQIEEDAFTKIRAKPAIFQSILDQFAAELKNNGGIRREDLLLKTLGGEKYQNHVFFLLSLSSSFARLAESKEFHPLWAVKGDSLDLAKKAVAFLKDELKKTNQPINTQNYRVPFGAIASPALASYLETSKLIQRASDGLFGLKEWPEINPRGVKDKAYLVLKSTNAPLHFSEVAKRIGKNALPQTVHNELIKDQRFVLVGRGLYALRAWGYEPGMVKDVITRILKNADQPLAKADIVNAVLKQRFVKENTISLNLSDKKYFERTAEGKYTIRQA